ncbi:MAG: YihY/virulence factor BrkB family protein [Verrucomicrobiota bacterium]|nr:YihY/virulence factor BrkB family protein [Verrucomicrobiota bacterium]
MNHYFRTAWQLLKATFVEWWNDNTFRLSASLAFYTIFSIAPVMLIAVGAASLFLTRQSAVEAVTSELQSLIGAQGAQAVRQVLESQSGFGQGIWAITTGVITFLLGASVVFAELQSALNQIWDVEAAPHRGVILKYLLDRLRSFGIALSVGFLLLVSLVLSAGLTILQNYFNNWMPGVPLLWHTLNVVASFAIVALLFALIYRYLPDAVIAWKDVWIGAAVTSALFTIGKSLISVYLGQTATASAFGAAGSFAVLLIWIYYSALICFFGAEFTQVYARTCSSAIRPEEHAVRVGNKEDTVSSPD